MSHRTTKIAAVLASAGLGIAGVSAAAAQAAKKPEPHISFSMIRSSGAVAANCLPHAHARVTVRSTGPVEIMDVTATGLPKNTDFDLFVIQVPDAPFGVSWYQGDLETGPHGGAHGRFVGRFSVETFAVAPGTAPAPTVHSSPIADATANPPFAPVHTYHLGLWFNSPKDAAAAGCPSTVTPFNGEHNAGVQALSTRQFGQTNGPLRHLKP
jgi:hypothetical protein